MTLENDSMIITAQTREDAGETIRIKDSRKRFVDCLLFEKTDRPPYFETLGFWPQTLQRWENEGLPQGMSGEEYFNMESYCWPPFVGGATRLPIYPKFTEEIISETESYRTVRTPEGILQKEYKLGRSMPQFLEFPVKTPEDWYKLKWRLDASLDERYAEMYPVAADFNKRLNVPKNREVVPFPVDGAYAFPRNLFGEVGLAYAYHDYPELLHDIMQTWLKFYCEFTSRVCRVMEFDFVYLFEDMAFNTGPLISPEMVKEFIVPYYKDLISHLKTLGFKLFMLDCDGNATKILPLFVETGVNCFMPCEINAGMEPRPIQLRYGKRLSLCGGISKSVLVQGKQAIYEDIMRKVPELLRHGGYAPGIDHAVPPDVSLENYAYFVELVRKLGREIKPEQNTEKE
jgi:uroporphyrinogen decarboxylase